MVERKVLENLLTENLKDVIKIDDISSVGGGSINNAIKVVTDKGSYFIKNNHADCYPHMFEKEALGLELLKSVNEIDIPEVLSFFEYMNDSFLVLRYIESNTKSTNFWQIFGEQLANLHKHTNSYFGLDYDNYIGSLYQSNSKKYSWAEFYIMERLEKQVALASDNNLIDKATTGNFGRFYNRIEEIFPDEPPALIHGDLWSGNYMVNQTGKPVLIDPAVYYGHREMDIGMSMLFGGFDSQFYHFYNEYYPLETGWEKRIDYCNLYFLMVHVNLFGGRYISSVKSIIQKF